MKSHVFFVTKVRDRQPWGNDDVCGQFAQRLKMVQEGLLD
jgi:hypothetical protein